mmetsp:Transcript_73921/g.173551  ORF Transcript_73921/g.173551 Transcript_73921/m.173551 type:complete len:355 (-) Transcript_73921:284-1348(-)
MEDILDLLLDTSAPLQSFEPQILSAATTPPAKAPESRVSTVTASFALTQTVDLRLLALFIPGGNVIHDPKSTALVTAHGERRRSFQNQATVELRLSAGRHCCAAVFSNGKVKLTGCRSEEECHEAARLVVRKLRRTGGDDATAVPVPAELGYQDMELVMIKCDFDLGFTLDLHRAFSVLRGHFDKISFDPERYCAVKIHVPTPRDPRGVTVCVFHTGKAFASGRHSVSEVVDAFSSVSGTLLLNRHAVFAALEKKQRKRRKPEAPSVVDPVTIAPAPKRAGTSEELWSELIVASQPAASCDDWVKPSLFRGLSTESDAGKAQQQQHTVHPAMPHLLAPAPTTDLFWSQLSTQAA